MRRTEKRHEDARAFQKLTQNRIGFSTPFASILQQGAENLDEPRPRLSQPSRPRISTAFADRLGTMASTLVGLATLKPQELHAAADGGANAVEKIQQQLKEIPLLR